MSYQKTKDAFNGLITKPPLSDQLLSRPPFKFIVDILSNVIKSTGYLKKDFPKDMLESAGMDKDTKVVFLEKLISLLDDGGELSHVKALKIIGGKDPDDTNLMLQKLANKAKNYSSTHGSEKSEKKKSSKSKERDKSVSSSDKKSKKDSSGEKKEHRERSKEKHDKNKVAEKDTEPKKKSSSSKERSKSKEKKHKSEKKDDKKDEKKEEKKKKTKVLRRGDSMIAINGDAPKTPNNDEDVDPRDEGYDDREEDVPNSSENMLILNDRDSPPLSMANHILQAATSPVKTDDSGVGDDSPRPPPPAERAALLRQATGAARPQTSMGRPGTAASRPAPPKIKKKQIATIDNTPQPTVELKAEIITESSEKPETNDDNFLIENDDIDEAPTFLPEATVNEEDRGALVQKIMEKKAEIEDSGTKTEGDDNDADKTMSIEREKVRSLQVKLQDLTRSAYPLARLFDFASDDIESMIKELEKWRLEQRKNEQVEQNEKALGLGDSAVYIDRINNLQKDIQEMKSELAATKKRILINKDKIQMLTSNV